MPPPVWQPTVGEVGALLRARTVDANGVEVGTFGPTTRPTAAAVETLVVLAVGQIQGEIGPDIPAVLHDQARHCAILGAAVLIERSYWPEQQDDSRTPSAYVALHERAMAALATAQRSYTATASAGGGMGLGSMRLRPVGEVDAP